MVCRGASHSRKQLSYESPLAGIYSLHVEAGSRPIVQREQKGGRLSEGSLHIFVNLVNTAVQNCNKMHYAASGICLWYTNVEWQWAVSQVRCFNPFPTDDLARQHRRPQCFF